MALKIDTLQCSVGEMRLPFTPEVMQVKMRIVLNRHIGRDITVQATRIR